MRHTHGYGRAPMSQSTSLENTEEMGGNYYNSISAINPAEMSSAERVQTISDLQWLRDSLSSQIAPDNNQSASSDVGIELSDFAGFETGETALDMLGSSSEIDSGLSIGFELGEDDGGIN